ncbi:hypothetical protein EV356DRAFT_550757, partial [Viridothelium virens]
MKSDNYSISNMKHLCTLFLIALATVKLGRAQQANTTTCSRTLTTTTVTSIITGSPCSFNTTFLAANRGSTPATISASEGCGMNATCKGVSLPLNSTNSTTSSTTTTTTTTMTATATAIISVNGSSISSNSSLPCPSRTPVSGVYGSSTRRGEFH